MVDSKNLRIIPVGGASEIKRIYKTLVNSIDEYKSDLKGKVAFILDTDSELVEFETPNINNILIKRFVNDVGGKKTDLVNISSNPKSPATEIEDILNGKAFAKVLATFKDEYPNLLSLNFDDKEEIPSYIAMNFRLSEYEDFHKFLDTSNNKYEFSQKYIEELCSDTEYLIPSWVEELKRFFN